MYGKGDRVQVRYGGSWRDGTVSLASPNGKSLAVDLDLDDAVASLPREGRFVAIDPEKSCFILLLVELDGQFVDVGSGEQMEVRLYGPL